MNARVLTFAVFVVATSAVPSMAADDDWKRVTRLEKETVVIVTVEGAEPLRGSLISADAEALEIAVDGPAPARVVKRFDRATILEVKTPHRTSNPIGCAFAGYFGGALIGAFPGALVGHAIGRDSGPALAGMVTGWFAGGTYVYGRCRTHPERIVYRAP